MRTLPAVALILFSISLLAQNETMSSPDAKQQTAAKIFAAKSKRLTAKVVLQLH